MSKHFIPSFLSSLRNIQSHPLLSLAIADGFVFKTGIQAVNYQPENNVLHRRRQYSLTVVECGLRTILPENQCMFEQGLNTMVLTQNPPPLHCACRRPLINVFPKPSKHGYGGISSA